MVATEFERAEAFRQQCHGLRHGVDGGVGKEFYLLVQATLVKHLLVGVRQLIRSACRVGDIVHPLFQPAYPHCAVFRGGFMAFLEQHLGALGCLGLRGPGAWMEVPGSELVGMLHGHPLQGFLSLLQVRLRIPLGDLDQALVVFGKNLVMLLDLQPERLDLVLLHLTKRLQLHHLQHHELQLFRQSAEACRLVVLGLARLVRWIGDLLQLLDVVLQVLQHNLIHLLIHRLVGAVDEVNGNVGNLVRQSPRRQVKSEQEAQTGVGPHGFNRFFVGQDND